MDRLDDFSSAGSSLLWLWIIEYLACFKEVDTSILHDLIEMAPEIPDDLAKATGKMVALRCLEDFFGSSDKVNNYGLFATEKKVVFALSERCEDVLLKILQETSAYDLKMAGPELLKWDVHPFIMHKRTSMPKCALQQLKDTILEGTHPLAASLKESSGLMCVNECGTLRVGDLDHNDQSMLEKEHLLPPTCENRGGLPGNDLRNGNALPCKRGRDEMAARDMAGHPSEVQEESDLNCNSKKIKQDPITNHQSADEISVPVCGKETVDGHTADKMPQDEPVQNAIMDEANVTEPRTSIGVHSVGSQRKDSVDESRGEMEYSRREEMSNANDEYHNERIYVAVKKSHFLSSKTSLGHDSFTTSGWTVQNLCVKCNKDGQLLSCSTSTCPLSVHENCLGFPVKFDEKGNFHCPFCAHTLAISEYLEAKKKASMARKELAAFIQMGLEHHRKGLAERLHRKDPGHSGNSGDKDIHENGHMGGRENNREIQNGQRLHEVNGHLCQKGRANKKKAEQSASLVNANSPCREEETNTFSGIDCVSNGEKAMEENIINECPSDRVLEGQPEHAPPDPNSDCDKLTCTNTYIAPVDHAEAKGEIQKEDLQQSSSEPPEKPVIALNIDGEENSEGENKFIISNYWVQFRRQETHYPYPATTQLRRKKVLWTAKEEEMLKKGVQNFTSVDDRTIPWKKILEFGRSVFLSGRTTIELKDKWRNMCKGSPKV